MRSASPPEVVRRLFAARAAGDVPLVLDLLDPAVEVTTFPGGRTLRGHADVRAAFERERAGGGRVEVHAHRVVAEDDAVIVHGRVRVFAHGGLSDSPAAWRFELADGRVIRIAPVPLDSVVAAP